MTKERMEYYHWSPLVEMLNYWTTEITANRTYREPCSTKRLTELA